MRTVIFNNLERNSGSQRSEKRKSESVKRKKEAKLEEKKETKL